MQMFDDPNKPVTKASKRAKLEKPVGTTPATPEVSGQLWLHVLHEWVPTFSAKCIISNAAEGCRSHFHRLCALCCLDF